MAGNVIVKLLPFKAPGTVDSGSSNAANIAYNGSRPGTDRTITADSLQYRADAFAFNSLSSDKKYLAYIGTRPGVDIEGERGVHLDGSHGLFGEYGVPDMKAIQDEVSNLQHSPMYRLVVSVTDETAGELGYDTKEKWEAMIRNQVTSLSSNLGIPLKDMNWVAALHRKDGHPHVHISVWDRTDRKRFSRPEGYVIPKTKLINLRADITKAVYADKRVELYGIKNASRDFMLQMAKDNAQQVRDFLKRINDAPLADPDSMRAPSLASISALSKDLLELSAMMPGRGRVDFKFMPEDVKFKVEAIVKKLLENPVYSEKLTTYIDVQKALAMQFVLRQDKLDQAVDKATADIVKRVSQIVLRTASSIQGDTTKAAIVERIPYLLKVPRPISLGPRDTIKFMKCLAAANVDMGTAVVICNKSFTRDSLVATAQFVGTTSPSTISLVQHVYENASEKVSTADWIRISDKLDALGIKAAKKAEDAELAMAKSVSMGLMRSVFSLLGHSRKSHNALHNFFTRHTGNKKTRDSLYTQDELE